MSSVFGYVHFSIGPQEIEAAKTKLAAAGAKKITVEPKPASGAPPHARIPPQFAALKKQPALVDLIGSAKKGDTLIVARLYHLAPAILRLFCASENLDRLGIGLVSLDDKLDTRQPGGDRIFASFDALALMVADFGAKHRGGTLHIMEGNGAD